MGSFHYGGVHMLYGDSRVEFISDGINFDVYQAQAIVNDGAVTSAL